MNKIPDLLIVYIGLFGLILSAFAFTTIVALIIRFIRNYVKTTI